jgi:hypothetical protein
MIKFHNGPAAESKLQLKRTPILLRVVIDGPTGVVDALDQLTDKPSDNEAIYAYQIDESSVSRYHVTMSPRSKSYWGIMADYHYIESQPSDEIMRDTMKWRAWCQSFQTKKPS